MTRRKVGPCRSGAAWSEHDYFVVSHGNVPMIVEIKVLDEGEAVGAGGSAGWWYQSCYTGRCRLSFTLAMQAVVWCHKTKAHAHLVEGCELHRKGLLVHCQLSSVKSGEIVVPQAHLGGARPQRWVTKDVLLPRAQGRHFSPRAKAWRGWA